MRATAQGQRIERRRSATPRNLRVHLVPAPSQPPSDASGHSQKAYYNVYVGLHPILFVSALSGSQAPPTPLQLSHDSPSRTLLDRVRRVVHLCGGTPAVQAPQRSRSFDQWRSQWEVREAKGNRSKPARHNQVRPMAPQQGRSIASAPASTNLQRASGPGFLRARHMDSLIHQAGPAGGPRSPRAAARDSQAPIWVARLGSAGMEHIGQGGGRLPRHGPRNKPRSVSRGPRGPGVHSLLPQFDAGCVQARPAAPGNGGGAISTAPAPPCVPHPPVRSSPKLSNGVRRGLYSRLTQFGIRQGTGC
ncbi:hypothetical protein NDU88_004109 [Pleurodeles waltl]|uniref:Uncharacterized protein n=1 Tax=Pleurodeles waltl TaxID=8319 RepID=A0AAV7PBT3_PLEWA|nr:hypothetical protein NDU88_004109 [Pleurodeles waltl]